MKQDLFVLKIPIRKPFIGKIIFKKIYLVYDDLHKECVTVSQLKMHRKKYNFESKKVTKNTQ